MGNRRQKPDVGHDKTELPCYEPPVLLPLGELQRAAGACSNGSVPAGGQCREGSAATGSQCRSGGAAGPICKNGVGAFAQCRAGFGN